MRDCPNCGFSNFDNAERCVSCRHVFEPAQPADDAVMAEEEEGDRAPKHWPPEAAEPEAEPEPERDPEARNEVPNEAAASPVQSQDLVDIEKTGRFVIGVIGFATSGKTFFIQRLKDYMREEGQYEPSPPPAPADSLIEGTTRIEWHKFDVFGKAGGADRGRFELEPFYLIDIPGDKFRVALEAAAVGAQAEILENVLRVSHALVIVLPGDEVLAPPVSKKERLAAIPLKRELSDIHPQRMPGEAKRITKRRKELERALHPVLVEERLETLLRNIQIMSALASDLVDSSGNKLTLQAWLQLSEREKSEALNGKRRGPAPFAFVTLAKADLLMGSEQGDMATVFPHVVEADLLDTAPADLVRLHRPKHHRRVTESFPWHKFDFVTAFEDQPKNDQTIHYFLDHYGVAGVVDWIQWARDYSKRVGRRSPDPVSRLQKLRSGWERFEGAVVRSFGRWREEGALLDPAEMGVDPECYPAARHDFLQGLRTWRSRALGRLMRPGSRLPRLLFAGGAALALLLIPGLLGFYHSADRPGYAFDLEPVYGAELRHLKDDNPVFTQGVTQAGLQRWQRIPGDGGWFSFHPNNPARAGLDNAMDLIPSTAGASRLDEKIGQAAIDNLSEAAGEDPSQVRAANSYHTGLLNFMMGRYESSADSFRTANAAIDDVLKRPPAGTRYDETASRVPVVQAAILLGEGVAELEGNNPGAAATALRRARQLVAQEQSRIIVPDDVGEFWYPVASREPAPMLRLSTADIWANLLAALIRVHAQGDEDSAAQAAAEMAALVDQAKEHANKAADHPELAVNLMVAAARSGDMDSLGTFYVAEGAPRQLRKIADQAHAIASPEGSDALGTSYWRATGELRRTLQRAPDYSGRGAPEKIEAILNRYPADRPALSEWLADAMETEFDKSSGAANRAVTLNYGQYYSGMGWWRARDARAPLGLVPGILLTLLVLAFLAILWLTFRRVKATYLRFFVPQHRLDRLRADRP